MKNDHGDDLILKDFEKRLDTDLSPEIIELKLTYNPSDLILADLLTWLRSFNERIFVLRKEFGLDNPVSYPPDPSIEILVKLVFDVITYEKYDDFKDRIKKLREEYQLPENWDFSIEVAIIANTLLIPPDESIRTHYPVFEEPKKEPKPKGLRDLAMSVIYSPEIKRTREALRLFDYPSIYFTHKVSVDELKRWIDKNANLIRAIQHKLPKKRLLRSDRKTRFWGQVAWILKQDGITSWAKMTKAIEKLIETQRKPGDEITDDFTEIAPEPVEIEKYYSRFIESLKKLQPK